MNFTQSAKEVCSRLVDLGHSTIVDHHEADEIHEGTVVIIEDALSEAFAAGLAEGERRGRRLSQTITHEALKAIRSALSADCSKPGSYHLARKFLDSRDIYNDDLSGLYLLLEVADVALAARSKRAKRGKINGN